MRGHTTGPFIRLARGLLVPTLAFAAGFHAAMGLGSRHSRRWQHRHDQRALPEQAARCKFQR
ncbi:MAG: hypothetical protein CMF72_09620 [Mameliella sp.]|nr:hypothetical protein [Mameliella sp.]